MSGKRGKRSEQESVFWRRTTPNPTKGKGAAKDAGDRPPPAPPPKHPVRTPTSNRRGG